MSLRLSNDDISVMEEEGQCGKCDEVFPFVNILRCRQLPRITQGDLPHCSKCHQRLHPGCRMAQSVLRPPHFACWLCQVQRGTVVCAMCTLDDEPTDEILEGVLMCTACSEKVHCLKQYHSDHFYPVAAPQLIPVMGAVRWDSPLNHAAAHPGKLVQQAASHKCSLAALASRDQAALIRHAHAHKINVQRSRDEFSSNRKLLLSNRHCHKNLDAKDSYRPEARNDHH